MKPLHKFYIAGSIVSAVLAVFGLSWESPFLYATLPGVIGGIMCAVAFHRFAFRKEDLAGLVATTCGFFYYQAFQANPYLQSEFVQIMEGIEWSHKAIGLCLSNLTTALLLISVRAIQAAFPRFFKKWTPASSDVDRKNVDVRIIAGFWVIFALVALPNIFFGKVIIGAINNIIYQRMTWSGVENYSGFTVYGGALGLSLANLGLWATSMFMVWLYLLESKRRKVMLVIGPLVLLWTASVVFQGSRTYTVATAFALIVYFLGSPRFKNKRLMHLIWGLPALFIALQISTHFRGGGLQSVNFAELSSRIFEIRGNEGASAQIDGVEYFRTELMEKNHGPNAVIGLVRGLIERPLEGVLMPVPRSLFPLKPNDQTGQDFNLWFQNVRLGVPSSEAFLGASPGLIGRELIKYGIFGPLSLFFWLGLLLAFADGLYAKAPQSDLHRISATVLAAFIVAQARDFVPVWFIPFLPAAVLFAYVLRKARIGLTARRSAIQNRPALASGKL